MAALPTHGRVCNHLKIAPPVAGLSANACGWSSERKHERNEVKNWKGILTISKQPRPLVEQVDRSHLDDVVQIIVVEVLVDLEPT